MVGIYGLISPSKKMYIGQSWDIEARYRWYKCHDAKEQPYLFNSFKKYGFDAHEIKILHELPNDVEQEVLDRYEIFYMQVYKDAGFILLNTKEGGRGGKHSEESKRKMAEWQLGRKKSDEHRKNISAANTGRKLTPEWIKNSVEGKRKNGFAVSDQARENCRKAQTGRKHSEESKLNRSIALKGLKKSDEQKRKLSEARKLWCKNNPDKVRLIMEKLNSGKAPNKY